MMADTLPGPVLADLDETVDPTTLLNAALAAERAGEASVAASMLAALRQRLPYWDEVPLRQAETLRARGDSAGAIAAYETVLELNPRRREALLAQGVLLLADGQVTRAQLLLLRCCGIAPDQAQAWDALGASLMLTNDWAAAESAFAHAQMLEPDVIAYAVHRAEAAFAAGSGPEEIGRLECVLREDPTNAAVLTALGEAFERLGRRAEAIDHLALAATLRPDEMLPHASLAQCLVRANRIAESLGAFERAIALAPSDPSERYTLDLRNNHAATLLRLHRFAEAAEALEALVARHGEQAGLMNNWANALVSLGRQDEGAAVARRAVANAPAANLTWRSLCNALPYCEGIGGAELLAAARAAGRTMPRHNIVAPLPDPDPHRRLRVGLLSPTLKTHPVGWLTAAGFENLDPARFELHAIGAEHGADPLFRRFRQIAASWTTLDGRIGRALIEHLHALRLDVLIDLGGYGDQGLMPLCAERLAPVQIKWVGAQNHSSGLAEMDWFLTDARETPQGFERFYAERLLRLPDGYVCYSPPPYAPEVAPLPALATGVVTFGCFNNLAKVTPGTIAAWARVLRAVPGSRFILKCHQMADPRTRESVLACFAAHGVDRSRIVPRGGAPHRALLGEYNEVDIVLDPFPYAGGLTTCEALWMGVPVVTLAGEIFAARHSASHLGNVGLTDWVADDLDAYQAIAVAKASDLAALAALRAGMRARVRASPLCDGPRFGRHLGLALRQAWQDWCATQARRRAA